MGIAVIEKAVTLLVFCLAANALLAQMDNTHLPPSTDLLFPKEGEKVDIWENPVVEAICYQYDYHKRRHAKQIAAARPFLLVIGLASLALAFVPTRRGNDAPPNG